MKLTPQLNCVTVAACLMCLSLTTRADTKSETYLKDYLTRALTVKDDTKRLAAYDKVAKYVIGLAAKEKKEVESRTKEQQQSIAKGEKLLAMLYDKVAGDWTVWEEVSPIDDSKTVRLNLEAASGGKASLHIRRNEGELDAFISTDQFLGSRGIRVTTRVDKEKPVSRTWDISTDHKGIFHPNAPLLLKVLKKHETLVVRLTPYSENTRTYIFNLKGLDEISGKLN